MRVKTIKPLAISLLLSAAVVLCALLVRFKVISTWPFRSPRAELSLLLGIDPPRWFEKADVVPWAPDPDYKPLKYYVSAAMTEEEFRNWAQLLKLPVRAAPGGSRGVMALPDGVSIKSWPAAPYAPGLEARGAAGKAVVYALLVNGGGFIVVTPQYGQAGAPRLL